MDKFRLEQFVKGWVVGDFDPSVIKTKDFEFGVQKFHKGQEDAPHTHKIAEEITVVVYGKFELNGEVLAEGDVFWLHPNEISRFKCLEDGATAVIKIPSVKGDKYSVE